MDMVLSIGIITGKKVNAEKIFKKIDFPKFLGVAKEVLPISFGENTI